MPAPQARGLEAEPLADVAITVLTGDFPVEGVSLEVGENGGSIPPGSNFPSATTTVRSGDHVSGSGTASSPFTGLTPSPDDVDENGEQHKVVVRSTLGMKDFVIRIEGLSPGTTSRLVLGEVSYGIRLPD